LGHLKERKLKKKEGKKRKRQSSEKEMVHLRKKNREVENEEQQ